MSHNMSTDKRMSRDADLKNAEAALHRAAQRVRERASRTGGYLVVLRNGVIVEDRPGLPHRDTSASKPDSQP